MKKSVLLALSASLIIAAGCSDDKEEAKGCSSAQDCSYPCEYCDGGSCVANPGMANDPQCASEPKSCSTSQDCNYPCQYCDNGTCNANPSMVDDPQCKPAEACKCDDGSACPDGDKSKCAAAQTCKCDDGTDCPNGDKSKCAAAQTCKCDDGTACPEGDKDKCGSASCTCDDGSACPEGDKDKCGAVTCTCDDGTDCPDGDKDKCDAESCKCDDGSACPDGESKDSCVSTPACTGGATVCSDSCRKDFKKCSRYCQETEGSDVCCELNKKVYCYDPGSCKCGDDTNCPDGDVTKCEVAPGCTCDDGTACPDGDKNKCEVAPGCTCDDGTACPDGDKNKCEAESCTCDDGTACPDGDKNKCEASGKQTTTLTAQLTMGSKLFKFLANSQWETTVPYNKNSNLEGKNIFGAGDIVMMLCEEDDPNCIKEPKLVRVLTNDEREMKSSSSTEPKPLQMSFNIKVSMKNLPVGKYNMMLFEDSKASVVIGRDWQSPNPQCKVGRDWWRCIISEFDLALISKEDYDKQPGTYKAFTYPEPKTLPVEIKECSGSNCTADLGTLYLGHYGDRNISEDYRPDNGLLAVATYWGIRVVDLSTEGKPTVMKTPDGKYDFPLVDENGEKLTSKNYIPCGLIDGGDNKTVWVTMKYGADSGKAKNPQIAVPFDVTTQKQIGNKHVILSHSIKNGTEYDTNEGSTNICMGYVKDGNLFGLSRAYSHGNGVDSGWVSFAPDIAQVLSNTKNVESINSCILGSNNWNACYPDNAGKVNRHPQYLKGVVDVAMWHGVVYTIRSAFDKKGDHSVASDAQGRCSGSKNLCINKSKIVTNEHASNAEGVKVSKRLDDMNEQLDGGAYDEGTCNPDFGGEVASPSIYIVEKSANEAWLFASKCTKVKAWKLSWNGTKVTETPMDIGGLDNNDISERYGEYIQAWALSPDGKTLFGAPSGRARANFAYKKGIDDDRKPINRLMMLVLDVSGSAPKVSTASQFNRNIDNFKGQIPGDTGEKLSTPEIDPGLQILPFTYYQYFNLYKDSLAGSIPFVPGSTGMHSPMIAVAGNNLWYSQKGNKKSTFEDNPQGRSPKSALGHYSDLAVYDLEKAEMLYFPNNNETGSERYFHPYAAGGMSNSTTNRFAGFHLQPDTGESTVSMGIVYIKK